MQRAIAGAGREGKSLFADEKRDAFSQGGEHLSNVTTTSDAKNARLQELNRGQTVSETDLFTLDRYRQFFRHLPKAASRVLDVGCNTGRGGSVLKECSASLKVVGLDCVPERLEKLPAGVYEQTICGFSTEIPAKDDSFDAVLAGELIEHFYPADVDRSLAEFFRVLRIGGRLLLTTPNPNSLKNRLRGLTVLGPAHLSQHFPDTLRLKLRMIGFSRIRLKGSGKLTWRVGENFPWLSAYGSYLAMGDKR